MEKQIAQENTRVQQTEQMTRDYTVTYTVLLIVVGILQVGLYGLYLLLGNGFSFNILSWLINFGSVVLLFYALIDRLPESKTKNVTAIFGHLAVGFLAVLGRAQRISGGYFYGEGVILIMSATALTFLWLFALFLRVKRWTACVVLILFCAAFYLPLVTLRYVDGLVTGQMLRGAMLILLGTLFKRCKVDKAKKRWHIVGVMVVTLVVGALYFATAVYGMVGVDRHWQQKDATRRIESTVQTALPLNAEDVMMKQTRTFTGTKSFMGFGAPRTDIESWVQSGVLTFKTDVENFGFNQTSTYSTRDLYDSYDDDVYDDRDTYVLYSFSGITYPKWWVVSEDDFAADICATQGYREAVYTLTVEKTAGDIWYVRILAVSPLK